MEEWSADVNEHLLFFSATTSKMFSCDKVKDPFKDIFLFFGIWEKRREEDKIEDRFISTGDERSWIIISPELWSSDAIHLMI